MEGVSAAEPGFCVSGFGLSDARAGGDMTMSFARIVFILFTLICNCVTAPALAENLRCSVFDENAKLKSVDFILQESGATPKIGIRFPIEGDINFTAANARFVGTELRRGAESFKFLIRDKLKAFRLEVIRSNSRQYGLSVTPAGWPENAAPLLFGLCQTVGRLPLKISRESVRDDFDVPEVTGPPRFALYESEKVFSCTAMSTTVSAMNLSIKMSLSNSPIGIVNKLSIKTDARNWYDAGEIVILRYTSSLGLLFFGGTGDKDIPTNLHLRKQQIWVDIFPQEGQDWTRAVCPIAGSDRQSTGINLK